MRPTGPAAARWSFRPRGSCRRTAPLSFRFSVARANLSPFSAPHGDNPDPAPPMQQRTIKNVIRATGVGLHSGEKGYLRSEEHTSELQSIMRISYAVYCLKTKK